MEIKEIKGFKGYSIDTSGNVWSARKAKTIRDKKTGRILGTKAIVSNQWKELKAFDQGNGYLRVNLGRDGKIYQKFIHHLVLETFVGLRPSEMEACHSNGKRTDNRLENLRWDTRKNNHADAIRHGTHSCLRKGEDVPTSKLKEEDIVMIRELLNNSKLPRWRIGELFGVSRQAINSIKWGATWKHIT